MTITPAQLGYLAGRDRLAYAADRRGGRRRLAECDLIRLWIADSRAHNPCCNQFVAPHSADSLPDDIATPKAMMLAEQAARLKAEAMARNAEAELRARELVIER